MDTCPNDLTVESALKELWEMFPDRKFAASRAERGWDDGRLIARAEISIYGGRDAGGVFAGADLRECMQEVRAWGESQTERKKET